MLMKVLGLIWRPSFSSYRFSRNLSLWDLSKEDTFSLQIYWHICNSNLFPRYFQTTILTKIKEALHCLNISCQSCQANVQPVSHWENLLKICGDHLSLDAKPPVCCYRHTVFPPHGHDGPAVVRHYRLEGGEAAKITTDKTETLYYWMHDEKELTFWISTNTYK